MLTLPDWSPDHAAFDGNRVVVSGWILPSSEDAEFAVLINGVAAQLQIGPAREDVVQAWTSVASATTKPVNFVAAAELASSTAALHVDLVENGQPKPLMRWSFSQREAFPLPDAQRRLRVHGTDSEMSYLRHGLTMYQRVKLLAARHAPNARRVLDWGCGSGAVGRYAAADPAWEYTGADVDTDNVAWCQENLRPHRFVALATRPPTPFEQASFDLIYGISVFTHLNEENQFRWLSELARITAPGGVNLLSVLGGQVVAKAPWLLNPGTQFERHGFEFFRDDHEIGRIVGDADYYGTAYHSESYVRQHWDEWFDVVDYIPAALGHQDMVVLRAR